MQRGNKALDLALALVPRPREQLAMIVGCQMRSQQSDRGQRDRTLSNQVENDGKTCRHPRCLNAVIGGVLREVQRLRAIGEQRGKPFAQIEASCIELHQECDELRRCLSFSLGCDMNLGKQLPIGQLSERRSGRHHALDIPRRFRRVRSDVQLAIAGRGAFRSQRQTGRAIRAILTVYRARVHRSHDFELPSAKALSSTFLAFVV